MANREELFKLYGKSKEFLIGKQNDETERAKVVLTPLSLDDMGLFNTKPDATPSEQKEQTLNLLAKSMSVGVEDVKNISVAYLEEIFECVMKINNFDKDDKMTKLKESLKRQE